MTSRSQIKEIGNRAHLSASFTGSEKDRKYTAILYRDGVVVGTVKDIPDDERARNASTGWKLALDGCAFVVAPAGNCEWTYTFSTNTSFAMADGQTRVGDTLRLVEQVNPSGAYPYLPFDALTFQGNFVRDDLEDETTEN